MITTRRSVADPSRIGDCSRTPAVRNGTGVGPGRRRARAARFTRALWLALAAALMLSVCLAITAVGRSHHAAGDRAPVAGVVLTSAVDSGQLAVLVAAAVPLHPTVTGHGDLMAMVGASAALGAVIALLATTRPWRHTVRAALITPRADRGPPSSPRL